MPVLTTVYICGMEAIYTLDEIEVAAGAFSRLVSDNRVFAFHGQMGAGKTTFIVSVCRHLQVNNVAGSPTYSIINAYDSSMGTIYHIDLYRLANEAEAEAAGVEDCLYSGSVCFVEWPEKAAGLLPADTVHVYLHVLNTTTRLITVGDK